MCLVDEAYSVRKQLEDNFFVILLLKRFHTGGIPIEQIIYPSCAVYVTDIAGHTEERDIYIFVYNGAFVSWIISVAKCWFSVISQKLCNMQICIIYH